MCSSNEASELLTNLSTASNAAAANPCLVILPGLGRIASACLLPLPPPRQSHTPSIIYTGVFLSFQYSCPNGILRAIFVELEHKKNVFNYLFPKVFALPYCFFPSFLPPLSLLLPLHWALAGCWLSLQTLYFSRLPNR